MGINDTGTWQRPRDVQDEDSEQCMANIEAESWKSWPNEAGFVGLDEHRGPVDLVVTGHIPSWAAGTLFRTGPGEGRLEMSEGKTHNVSHWFDGFGHTHRFDIIPSPGSDSGGDGSVSSASVRYSSRRNSQALIDDVKRRGWRAGVTFAQRADPCMGIFSKMMTLFRTPPPNNNVVVERNVPGPLSVADGSSTAGYRTGTRNLFVLTDSAHVQEIDADTMEHLHDDSTPTKLHPDLAGPLSCAHPQRDPVNGDLYNYNLSLGRRPTYRIFRTSVSTGRTDILATVTPPLLPIAYIHSLFLTPSYVVLCAPSSHLALYGIKILIKRNVAEALEPFDTSKLMKWVVIDRKGGKGVVASFTTPAGFFFHTINSFEEHGGEGRTSLVFDLAGYDDLSLIHGTYLDVLLDREDAARKFWIDRDGRHKCHLSIRRYHFTVPSSPDTAATGTADLVFSIPAPHCGELPTINPARATLRYRYVYSAGTRGLSTMMDSLVKTDLETHGALLWNPPRGHTPGEPIFVARPVEAGGTGEEDDGVLLCVVLDGTAERSYLLVLDARSMEEIGRADATFAIALGTHGVYAKEI
ncbi:torulene dioxygenase [Geosmithia morbida]|uniref:Torulene dioxygenase n=1 Tax=Geosmithia morbida TaxID=1094350 RepID=A0A9P4YRM7_9HYPO|nr:torulene dioxygenase [Geosmithia morbida]KAF4121485.1 torulene dioxygenase [Geosmithia morbida]